MWRYCAHYMSSGPYSTINYQKKKTTKRKSRRKEPAQKTQREDDWEIEYFPSSSLYTKLRDNILIQTVNNTGENCFTTIGTVLNNNGMVNKADVEDKPTQFSLPALFKKRLFQDKLQIKKYSTATVPPVGDNSNEAALHAVQITVSEWAR